jgi:asparagine synthase (glutamine-hydrolysing)
MCGIAGIFSYRINKDIKDRVKHMTGKLQHRGPDDSGIWLDFESAIAIGHRRLSVIDTSNSGHQPMCSQCGQYIIAFNGEIYNHLSLRKELNKTDAYQKIEGVANKFKWKGRSDTETLLEYISKFGVNKALKASTGMFSFALWDCHNNTLTLARDRIGEKPLYYGWVGDFFIFCSELKAIQSLPEFNNPIDRGALALYFEHCTVPSPYSIYENIFKLDPGSFITLQKQDLKQKKVNQEKYWDFSNIAHNGIHNQIDNDIEAVDKLNFLLQETISKQSVSDVPLGVFLSGGIDSSLVSALMQAQSNIPISTYTVGFDESGFDESNFASAVAKHLGTNHNELRVTANDALSVIPKLPELYDEPFADSSQVPTYLVCKAASRHVKVALSGDGGDELFGGYNRYLWGDRIWNKVGWMPQNLRKIIGLGIQSISTESWDFIESYLPKGYRVAHMGSKAHKFSYRLRTVNNMNDLYRSLVTEWPKDMNPVIGANILATKLDDSNVIRDIAEEKHRMMLFDSITYLPDDILTKVDRASMGVSLETRAPLLDHNVAELAWRLPLHMKIRNGQGKWVLRQILYKHIPPRLIERPKAGFAIPIGEWLRGPLREWAELLLDDSRLDSEGFLNTKLVRKIWEEHLSKTSDWTVRIWTILMFQSWLESQKNIV